MTAAVLTPFHGSQAVELGNRIWRKKVLPVGDVEYKGRMLHFTRDYLGRLVQSFNDRAYDQVPFQLADHANTHTNDPERTRGEITGMELGPDGLYVTTKVTPEGEQVLTANPRLGVSARIVEDYARSDGKHYPAAIQHVLGTLDPRIPGLGAWEAIEAASPVPDTVLDLSASSFAGEQAPPDAPVSASQPVRTTAVPDLNAAQQAKLARLLELPDDTLDALAAGGTVVTPEELEVLVSPGDGTGSEELSDEELDALIAAAGDLDDAGQLEDETAAPGYVPEGEPVTAGLTAEQQFEIDLARAQGEETARELAVVTARLRESDYLAEKDRLFANFGIPPYVVDLARPLLEGAGHVVEMSNGRSVDAGQVVRKVMTEMAQLGGLRDLGGAELGTPMDEPEGVVREQADASRDDIVNRFKSVTGLK